MHVKYEVSISYGSKVMVKVKEIVFGYENENFITEMSHGPDCLYEYRTVSDGLNSKDTWILTFQ